MTAAAFITGIGGQDGTYLAERLVAEGMEVHALVLEADGHPAHCPEQVVLHPSDRVTEGTRVVQRDTLNVRERPWASNRQPINDDRCCTDRLNSQGRTGHWVRNVRIPRPQ